MLRFAVLVFLAGCYVGQKRFDEIMLEKVKTKAGFDFQCQAEALQVVKVDTGVYGATGCGQKATYVGKDNVCAPTSFESEVVNKCQVVSDTFKR